MLSEDIQERIIEALADGGALKLICAEPGMPDRRTVQRWMATDEEFAARIARARKIGQDALIEECREIADQATPEDWQVAKLRIWHRQWEAAKRDPKNFGDRLTQAGDPDAPIAVRVIRGDL